MKSHRRRRQLRAAALALLAGATLAAPAAAVTPGADFQQASTAKIGDTPADYPGASRAPVAPVPKIGDTPADYPGASRAPVAPVPKIGDTPADYPGMPGAPAAIALTGTAPTRTHTAAEGGFDWPSAAIGAAGVGLLLVLVLGGFSVVSHRRTPFAH
jgi:hypothetical protein